MSIVYIYGLIDPRNELTIENVRYVGKTKQSIWKRLCKHVQDSKIGIAPVHKWIRKLKLDGQRPVYILLEECDENTWKETEKKYIALLRKSNRLLNVTDGGEENGNYNPKRIEVYCYDRNGDFIKKYSSILEAANTLQLGDSNLSRALNQKKAKTSGNCYWFTSPQKKENIIFLNPKIKNFGKKRPRRKIGSIVQYSINGEYINKFKNQTEAGRATGINHKLISECLNKTGQHYSGNYLWFYEDCIPTKIKKYNRKRNAIKALLKYDSNNMLLCEYPSIIEAKNENNFSYKALYKNLKGETKTANGFVWKYKNSMNNNLN